MLTWGEYCPEKSFLPDSPIFLRAEELKNLFQDPYPILRSELDAISAIDPELSNLNEPTSTRPLPIPGNTGCLYSEWIKFESIKSTMNKAATCLAMRMAQTARRHRASRRRTFE
jgi:hypothetical protein